MATHTQVQADLQGFAQIVGGSTSGLGAVKAKLLALRNQLASASTIYADTIATINGYVPDGAFETLAKDQLAKFGANKSALQTVLEGILDDLGVSYS